MALPCYSNSIAGRTCRVAGPADASKVLILFHGLTQATSWAAWEFWDFPKHTRLLKEPAAQDWRLVFLDGRNRHWSQGDDLRYVLEAFEEISGENPQAKVSVAGFSMGSFPVRWLLRDRAARIHRAIVHSGIYHSDMECDVPLMGLIAQNERAPAPLFVSFQGTMQASYNWAQSNLDNFIHGYDGNNHRIPNWIHRWWHPGNRMMLNWLAQPRTH